MKEHSQLIHSFAILAVISMASFGNMRSDDMHRCAGFEQELLGKQTNSKQGTSLYAFSAAQSKAIRGLLLKNPGWRIASISDNHDPGLAQYQREHPGYTPYFLERDFTGDGKKDFVIVLLRGKYFGVVWFRAVGDQYAAPQWLTRKGSLSDGGVFGDRRGLFVGGPFYSDNLALFVWDQKSKQMIRQPDDN